jgi:hypothetical protein
MHRTLVAFAVLTGLGMTMALPDNAFAGPFRYRGGAWDRRVGNTYYSSSPTYSYPQATSTIPWSYEGPGRDDPQTVGGFSNPRVYQYPSIPWSYEGPGKDDGSTTSGYRPYYYYTPNTERSIPWENSGPSRDNPD